MRILIAFLVVVIGVIGLAGYAVRHRPPTAGPPPVAYEPQIYNYQPDPSYQSGFLLRPMDLDIFAALARAQYSRTDLGDLFPQRPYQVRLLGDSLSHRIHAVFIDLDRDGKWEERWVLKPADVDRRLMDKQGPPSGIPFALRRGRWVPY